ncbi:kelch-like protein 41 [Penaeus japonicus]|uniref:kelch-like protein 41 n=1 Tax=Penaeus japonicus TaxID=27405 RepID=UPI001C7123AD|nr:kelch-like protein 41 [Penaeus japonicus]
MYHQSCPDRSSPWQSCLTTVSERLVALKVSGFRSDITLHLDGLTLKAHRLILAMNSPVFDKMLYSNEDRPNCILPIDYPLHDDPPEAFAWLLGYMYSGEPNLPSVPMALEVSVLATKYQMGALKTICSEYLKEHLNNVNVLKVYDAAVQLENADLVHRCLQIARSTTEDVFSTHQMRLLSKPALAHLLANYVTNTSEVQIFKGIMAWGRHRLASRGASMDDLRKEIEPFLPHVRFLAMTTKEFVEHVIPTNIFKSSEACAILINITQAKEVPLPDICCKIRDRRN